VDSQVSNGADTKGDSSVSSKEGFQQYRVPPEDISDGMPSETAGLQERASGSRQDERV